MAGVAVHSTQTELQAAQEVVAYLIIQAAQVPLTKASQVVTVGEILMVVQEAVELVQ
jgi:hypothetical protein